MTVNIINKDVELDTPKFTIGEVVKHRFYPFRGVIFDVDPEFMNSEEWYDSIPEDIRPKRNQHRQNRQNLSFQSNQSG